MAAEKSSERNVRPTREADKTLRLCAVSYSRHCSLSLSRRSLLSEMDIFQNWDPSIEPTEDGLYTHTQNARKREKERGAKTVNHLFAFFPPPLFSHPRALKLAEIIAYAHWIGMRPERDAMDAQLLWVAREGIFAALPNAAWRAWFFFPFLSFPFLFFFFFFFRFVCLLLPNPFSLSLSFLFFFVDCLCVRIFVCDQFLAFHAPFSSFSFSPLWGSFNVNKRALRRRRERERERK